MNLCKKCRAEMAMTDAPMLRYWIAKTGANRTHWKGRLGGDPAFVCPKCDAYALGGEFENGLAFYSDSVAAYLTVNDWDWWNRDPRECDIREWPDFGCLSFSEAALCSTVEYLREADANALNDATVLPFEPELVGVTGIPEDQDARNEWDNQLRILHERMRGEFSARELDAAVRKLVRILVDGSEK